MSTGAILNRKLKEVRRDAKSHIDALYKRYAREAEPFAKLAETLFLVAVAVAEVVAVAAEQPGLSTEQRRRFRALGARLDMFRLPLTDKRNGEAARKTEPIADE